MKDPIEQFFNKAKAVTLSQKEKDIIRARLLSEIQISKPQLIQNNVFVWQTFLSRHSLSVTFMAILFFTGATTTFAEKSYPGSKLYPVKTQINEKVLGLFALSPQSRAEFQIKLAERRLSEVEYLDMSSASSETKKIARENLEDQTRHAEDGVETFNLSEGGKLAISEDLSPQNTSSLKTVEEPKQASSLSAESFSTSSTEFPINKDDANKRLKVAKEKLSNLRKKIYEKNDLSAREKLLLKKEIFLTEKALYEIKERLNSEDNNFSEVEVHNAEQNVIKIENHTNDNNKSPGNEEIKNIDVAPKDGNAVMPEVRGATQNVDDLEVHSEDKNGDSKPGEGQKGI